MFIHDLIKMNYVNEGYLPNYPYHMTSDKEMFNAFFAEGGFFESNYPCVNPELQEQYDILFNYMKSLVDDFMENGTELPGWLYGYMLGSVISVNSPELDIDNLFSLFGMNSNIDNIEFTPELSEKCYLTSKAWVEKQTTRGQNRVPTVFGEPHVIKSLRLDLASGL